MECIALLYLYWHPSSFVLDNTNTTATEPPEQCRRDYSALIPLKPMPLFIAHDLYLYALWKLPVVSFPNYIWIIYCSAQYREDVLYG